MFLLTPSTDYESTLQIARTLKGEYDTPVIFHCFWRGEISEKHLLSIESCYRTNCAGTKNTIYFWTEKISDPHNYLPLMSPYCIVRSFDIHEEIKNTFMHDWMLYPDFVQNTILYSDFVRLVMLYKYGGVWFDLDNLFLRSMAPLFANYQQHICLYQWENQKNPNNAIIVCLNPKNAEMEYILNVLYQHRAIYIPPIYSCSYDVPLPVLVLPCSWFDADWIDNPFHMEWDDFFKGTTSSYSLDSFHSGAFTYHWHNRWNAPIEENSPIRQICQSIRSVYAQS